MNGSPSSFPVASQPDVVRSYQKDAYYQRYLGDQVASLFRSIYGTRTFLKHQNSIETASQAAYLGLTTGNQTLGEEYCDILQVGPDGMSPSVSRRMLLVVLTAIGPYAIDRLVKYIKSTRSEIQPDDTSIRGRLIVFVDEHQAQWRQWFNDVIKPFHLAIFYLSGQFYHLTNRIVSISHILCRQLRQGEERVGYEILGVLILVRLLTQGYMESRGMKPSNVKALDYDDSQDTIPPVLHDDHDDDATPRAKQSTTNSNNNNSNSNNSKCILCLSQRRNPTSTPCGHLFCWNCIAEWTRNKPECPLCRQSVSLPSLQILVHHH